MTSPDFELWQKLQQAGMVTGDMPNSEIQAQPWYLRVLQGLMGWFAAWFLLGSVFVIFKDLVREQSIAFILGVVLITGAYFIYKRKDNDFIDQFALAMSLTGQSLCVFAWHELLTDSTAAWCLMLLMGASLAWLMPSFIHRFLSASLAIWSLVMVCIAWPIVWLMPTLVVGLMAWLWLAESKWLLDSERVRPIAYAFSLAALQMHSLTLLNPKELTDVGGRYQVNYNPWLISLNEGLLAMIFVALVAMLLRRYRVSYSSKQGIVALVAAFCLALISQGAAGLTVAWSLILLGFAHSNRVLLAIGTASFWLYLSRYYYSLDMTLLNKSYLLIATGMFLLVLRKIGHRYLENSDA